MDTQILVLSGDVAAGKSTLAKRLADRFGAYHTSSRALLSAATSAETQERGKLQNLGDVLDAQTDGKWLADALQGVLGTMHVHLLVVDAARTLQQVEGIRSRQIGRVVHIHLTAPVDVLAERYEARKGDSPVAEFGSYADVKANATEANIDSLRAEADVVIDTAKSTMADVEIRTASALGLLSRTIEPLVDVIVGGQFGSEGKGNVANFIAPEYDVLMRVGGPNAGHYVIDDDGTKYCHRLISSGSRRNLGAKLLIGPGATITPDLLLQEIEECNIAPGRLMVDERAMIISAEDIEYEKQLVASIGSTGKGGGKAAARRVMRGRDGEVQLARDIPELADYVGDTFDVLEHAYAVGARVLLEGTQGTGLSLFHGYYPHVTSRDTAVSGTCAEAGIAPNRVRKVIMVCRSYPIRVMSPDGATSGPMAQEVSWGEIAQRGNLDTALLEKTEIGSVSKKMRRVSEFDWAQVRKAAVLNGVTDIALTFADYMDEQNASARRFEQLTDETIRFMEEVETVTGAPVSLISTGFHERCIIDRRGW